MQLGRIKGNIKIDVPCVEFWVQRDMCPSWFYSWVLLHIWMPFDPNCSLNWPGIRLTSRWIIKPFSRAINYHIISLDFRLTAAGHRILGSLHSLRPSRPGLLTFSTISTFSPLSTGDWPIVLIDRPSPSGGNHGGTGAMLCSPSASRWDFGQSEIRRYPVCIPIWAMIEMNQTFFWNWLGLYHMP